MFSDSYLMFKDLCSSGLTQKVQCWKLSVISLRDLLDKQFFLILPAKHKAHFPQYKNKSSHSSSALVGNWTNLIFSYCFWLALPRFWVPFSSCWTQGREGGFSDSCCKQLVSFKIGSSLICRKENPLVTFKIFVAFVKFVHDF